MKTEVTIDWISATMTAENAAHFIKRVKLGEVIGDYEPHAKFGYSHRRRWDSGVVAMWSEKRADMGVHLIFSGSSLRWLAAIGNDCLMLTRLLSACGARVSRVDLAIDIFDSGLLQKDLCKPNRLPYKGRGRTPKFTQVGDEEDGWTLYIGSRSSEKFVRIYAKDKEMKLGKADWKRIEVECKGMVAHWLGSAIPAMDAAQLYATCSTLVSSMVSFTSNVWSAALQSDRVELAIPKKTERDTVGWLINQIAPALAKCVLDNPNYDVLEQFNQSVQMEIAARQALDIARQRNNGR